MKELNIIMNEKIYNDDYFFYSENIDCKTIVEGLSKNFNTKLFARKTAITKKNKLIFNNIYLSKNIFFFLFNIFLSLKNRKKNIYLLISLTPYTFFSYLMLFFFSKNIFLYLRSDGFKEYSAILGSKWIFLYSFMFYIITKKVKIISCTQSLSKGKNFYYIQPSEIDDDWFLNRRFKRNKEINILYIGRVKVEKGIFSLLNLLKQINDNNIKLSIVGEVSSLVKSSDNRIKFLNYVSDKNQLIEIYDNHDILILPSYTEAHPKVIDESLSRLRPVIIFNEIKHVINNRLGVFCIERNSTKLREQIYFIINNYSNICNDLKKNKLPTKKYFLDNLVNILNNN